MGGAGAPGAERGRHGAGLRGPSVPRPPHRLLRSQLQEQLQRLLLVNAELRHKLAAVQIQLRAAQDRERERQQLGEAATPPAKEGAQGQAGAPGHQHVQEPEWMTAGAGASEDPVSAA